MPATRTHRPKPLQGNRAYTAQRRQLQKGLHPSRVPGRSRRGRAADGPATAAQANFLNPKVGPLKVCVARPGSLFDFDAYPQEHVHFIIVNLYKTLKHTPGFVDDKVWLDRPNLVELADYLIEQAHNLHPDGFDYEFNEEKKLRFSTMRSPGDLSDTHCLPLEWIPCVEQKVRPELFQLLMCVLAKIARAWHLDVMYNGYNDTIIDCPEEHFQGEDDVDSELMRDVLKYKKGGVAHAFHGQLRRYSDWISTEALIKNVKRYRPNRAEKEIKGWLLLGLAALENPTSIGNYVDMDWKEMRDESFINANDMYAFCWSFVDRVHLYSEEWVDSIAQQCGIIGPMFRTEYFPDREPVTKPDEQPIRQLAAFLNFGREIYFRDYHENFKKQRETDPELLINILT